MGYMHIENFYKNRGILAFKQCYAMEKIHGTSAHISYKDGKITYFSGGASHQQFILLFDHQKLLEGFALLGYSDITIYGEAYGGNCQRMSNTYGPSLKFIAFEVNRKDFCDEFLNVPKAEQIVLSLGLEFVDYRLIETTFEAIDAERDRPSTQAIRNGMGEDKKREGIVLRPPFELIYPNGGRLIAKHKNEGFEERANTPKIFDAEKHKIFGIAYEIAEEWVNSVRLEHVIDHLRAIKPEKILDITMTKSVIDEMIKDVAREAAGEIVFSDEAAKAIGKRTAILYKKWLENENKNALPEG